MGKYNYVRLYFTVDGKRYEVTGKTKAEAEEKKRLKLKALDTGFSEDLTVGEWARTWLETYIHPRVRPAGQAKTRGTMTEKSCFVYDHAVEVITKSIGTMRMTAVRDIHLQRIINNNASSLSIAHKMRVVIRALFSQAFASRIIEHDPSTKLTLPAAPKASRRSLTDSEREILLKVAETHPAGLWIRTLLRTGMRPSESIALRVKNVDIDNAVIHVVEAIEGGTDVPAPPKTSAGVRDIPILEDIREDLRQLIKDRDGEEYVFTNEDGRKMLIGTCTSWWRSFYRAMDLAAGAEHTPQGHIFDPTDIAEDGVPLYPDKDGQPRNGHRIAQDLVLYDLRHTFCTDLKRAGVPLATAKVVMGHGDISMTANIYMDTYSGEYQTVAELMNRKNVGK